MWTGCTWCGLNGTSFVEPQMAICGFTVPEMRAVPGRPSTGGCRKKGHTKRYYGMPCRQIPLIRRGFILEREAERSPDREMKDRAGRKLSNDYRTYCACRLLSSTCMACQERDRTEDEKYREGGNLPVR